MGMPGFVNALPAPTYPISACLQLDCGDRALNARWSTPEVRGYSQLARGERSGGGLVTVTAAGWAITVGVILALFALDLALTTMRPHAVGLWPDFLPGAARLARQRPPGPP